MEQYIFINIILSEVVFKIITINITILEISSSQEKEGVVCHKVAPLVFITQPTSHHHHHHHHHLTFRYQDHISL